MSAKYSDVLYGLPVINDPLRSDYDSKYPYFSDSRDQLRHIDWPQYAANDPHWEKHTTYLDGIIQMPLGPGALKLHYFMKVGRRWTSTYTAAGTFMPGLFYDDKTEGFIAEYKNINLSDNHRLTAGIEYQGLGALCSNPIVYQVKSAYLQHVIPNVA